MSDGLPLRLRRTNAADADLLFAWANDPDTRAASLRTAAIPRKTHLAWLARRLAEPGTGLWIGEEAGAPVGQVRCDTERPGEGIVSIAVAPEVRGRGIGSWLLAAGVAAARSELGIGRLVAFIRPENAASVALFRGAGFASAGQTERDGVPVLVFVSEAVVTLRLVSGTTAAGPAEPGTLSVVVDTAWTPPPGTAPNVVGLRPFVAEALATRDLFVETSALLDGWAAATDMVGRWTVEGISYWGRQRLVAWRWLLERLVWSAVLGRLRVAYAGAQIVVAPGAEDAALSDVLGLADANGGITTAPAPAPSATVAPAGFLARLRARLRRREIRRRLDLLGARVDASHGIAGRPLLVLTHTLVHQRIGAGGEAHSADPFLGPIVALLVAGQSGLRRLILELDTRVADDASWARLRSEAGLTLTAELLAARYAGPNDLEVARASASVVPAALQAVEAPLAAGGVDLAPALLGALRADAERGLAGRLVLAARARRFLAELRPAGLLLIDEYSRPEWVAAARAEGVRVTAVQHGVIHPWHAGYVHPDRPASLLLPDRLYVFGGYERRLLTERSIYRADEVVVAGSPRRDMAAETLSRDERMAVRRELGVAEEARLIVISTTHTPLFRRFYLVPALAALLDGPLPGVHLVIKLHPGERDEGPYRALIEGLGAARGFTPPPVTVTRDVDLYRLLGAADAHLGAFSTVLTDAVAAGTGNLLAAALATNDLLGYVAAGVAIPVRNRVELLAGLDALAAGAITPDARDTFLADHFLAGSASARIATDLEAWLPITDPSAATG